MDTLQKFEHIIQWFRENSDHKASELKHQEDSSLLIEIEKILQESLPEDFKSFYQKYNGEDNSGCGTFFGHSLMSLENTRKELEQIKATSKPENPHIENQEASNQVITRLNAIYGSIVPEEKGWFFSKNKWHKLIYDGSPGSLGGPYFYRTKKTSDREREILRLSKDQQKEVLQLFRSLHNLEKESYNWHEVECTLYGNGSFTFNRKFNDFSQDLVSFPENTVKKVYFHLKWLPLIKDCGGNFIGIDLDPDMKGTKGQVIIYGAEERVQFVVANSWEEFLDLIIGLIKSNPKDLLECAHLHDYLKGLILPA